MTNPRTHLASFFGFLWFVTAALILFTLGFILGLSALFRYMAEGSVDVQSAVYSSAVLFLGTLLGIAAVVSLLRFLDKPAAQAETSATPPYWLIAAGALGAGLVLFAGHLLQDDRSVNWLALPVLTLPAVALPIWTITSLAVRKLPLGSRWRTWSTFGLSLTATTMILLVLEIIVIAGILAGIGIYAALEPDFAAELESFSTKFAVLNPTSEEALSLLAPYLMKPIVLVPVIVLFSILIPLMEELIKPLAVWIVAGKFQTEAQGFALGAVCGAAFGLVESLNVSGQGGVWSVLLFMRIGTGLLHITTSGLMGGAIQLAVRERRYLRLAGVYLAAVLLHGLWNTFAVTNSFATIALYYTQVGGSDTLQRLSALGLLLLALMLFILVLSSNRRLRKQATQAPEGIQASQPGAAL